MLSLCFALAPATFLDDAEEAYRRRITPVVQVARDASPAVVYIQTGAAKVVGRDIFGRLITQQFSGSGSGVVLRKEGFIITNFHVIKDADPGQIQVSFDDEIDPKSYRAEVISASPEEDLALLKIEGDRDFPTIPLGKSSDLMLGETVVAIGNPYGQTHTVSQGIISGLHRNVQIPSASLTFDDLIQTDASINPGNSGGPLLNVNGELIGINSAMNMQAQNIGFAIPVDQVQKVLKERLLAPDSVPTWLGFEVDGGDHLQIRQVVPGSPADRAGLKPGDCIVAVGNQNVETQDAYRLARAGLRAEHEISLKVERNGVTRPVKLTPWEKNDGLLYAHLGLKVREQRDLVVISEVRPGGPADQLGLKVGDVVDAVRLSYNSRPRSYRVETREAFANLAMSVPAGSKITIDILRDLDGNGMLTIDERHRGEITVE